MEHEVVIYTDGSCWPNPGPGGWAAVLVCKGKRRSIFGYEEITSNNRMELRAVIEGLKRLESPCRVTVFSDSKYVVRGAREWVRGWRKRGWTTSTGTDVANRDLWEQILEAEDRHQLTWRHVKGHAGVPGNELADAYAGAARKQSIEYGETDVTTMSLGAEVCGRNGCNNSTSSSCPRSRSSRGTTSRATKTSS